MGKTPQNPHSGEKTPQGAAEEIHAPLEIDARELLGARREATIIHAGERYRLRVTGNNKLILTK